MALISENWIETTDVRFQRIKLEEYDMVPDLVSKFYEMPAPSRQPTERFGGVGAMGEIPVFTGNVSYGETNPTYNLLVTPKVFVRGMQIEKSLADDDQHNTIDSQPRALLRAMAQTRRTYALRPFNLADSVDTFFGSGNSENVALASNSHTTRAPGVSTATGFDNLVTSAFSAVALETARILGKGFKDDAGNLVDIEFDAILYPSNLYGRVHEVVKSEKKPGELETANVSYGAYELIENAKLTSSVNWALLSLKQMKSDGLIWIDREKGSLDFVEDFETYHGKWRVRGRWGLGHRNFRFGVFARVS